jgi:hypothetical protein
MRTFTATVRIADCYRTRQGDPTTTGVQIYMLRQRTHVKALGQTRW